MTILYFTATGNSLSVAKAVGGTLKSIPQLVENKEYIVEDDAGKQYTFLRSGDTPADE